jgi:hypothetical protein
LSEAKSAFDLRPIDLSPSGIEETAKLLRIVFPEATHLTPDYLHRLYFGNPLGETWGLSCFDDDGNLVAHNIMIPIKAVIFGKEEMGIWPFQLATHPKARMKGLFVEMTEATFKESAERGYTFLNGVGNQNSTPIFVKKWNYQSICPLDVKIGVGPIPPSRELESPDLRRIWDDSKAIEWRLSHAPQSPYRVKWRGDRGHIYADTGKYGVQVELGSFPRDLLSADMPRVRTWNPLRLWIGKDSTLDWSKSFYFDIPKRFRPSPLNLLWHDLTGQGRRHDPAKVQYDIFNFDAF